MHDVIQGHNLSSSEAEVKPRCRLLSPVRLFKQLGAFYIK